MCGILVFANAKCALVHRLRYICCTLKLLNKESIYFCFFRSFVLTCSRSALLTLFLWLLSAFCARDYGSAQFFSFFTLSYSLSLCLTLSPMFRAFCLFLRSSHTLKLFTYFQLLQLVSMWFVLGTAFIFPFSWNENTQYSLLWLLLSISVEHAAT